MKKIALCALSIVFAILLCGCTQSVSDLKDEYENTGTANLSEASSVSANETEDKTKVTYLEQDWIRYGSAELLVSAADNIYEGEITNIGFEIIDRVSGLPATIGDYSSNLCLCTVYEVDVTYWYKGENAEKEYFKIIGGIEGYKEDDQRELLNRYGIFYEHVGISVLEDIAPLQTGENYLFVLKDSVHHKSIINNTQFAFKVEETEQPTEFTYENIKQKAELYRELQLSNGDSVNISDAIKQLLEVRPYMDTVYRCYYVHMWFLFDKVNSIDEACEQELIDGEFYVIKTMDGTIIRKRVVNGKAYTIGGYALCPNAFQEIQDNKAILQLASDIEIYEIYYLHGEENRTGSAVYYKTNKGDYVYYCDYLVYDYARERYEAGNFLFTIKEFCEFERTIYDDRREEAKRNPDACGGVGGEDN